MTGTISHATALRHKMVLLAILAGVTGCTETVHKSGTNTAYEIGPELALPPEARKIIETAKARANVPRVDDVAPEVFQATDVAVWDGNPTFGAIWIAVPGALQPERVQIRNEETGRTIRAAMVADDAPEGSAAPIRLSAGAAEALGVGPLENIRVTVTALRKSPLDDSASLMIPTRTASPLLSRKVADLVDSLPPGPAPISASAVPSLNPAPIESGYVEVAQAYDPEAASRVHDGLQAQSIPAEIQEDFIRGESVYRVFASSRTEAEELFAALEGIRYANGEEGSDDGTLIAELPNFLASERKETPDWVELGTFSSRNEAMSVVQKLSRTAVPTEICERQQGLLTIFRVFAGPSDSDVSLLDPAIAKRVSEAFCTGVAATEATGSITVPQIASAEEAPVPELVMPVIPEGAVRIRVGESTGDLNITVANPFSEPVQVPVRDVMVSIPTSASPDLVNAIRDALRPLNGAE